jgi:hypothetical protein
MKRREFFKRMQALWAVAYVTHQTDAQPLPMEVSFDLTETWAHDYTQPFRVGDVVHVRMPQRFVVNSGRKMRSATGGTL